MQKIIGFCILLIISSCSIHSNREQKVLPTMNPREYQLGAYLWFQHSAEYKALTYQAYNIAREKVERDLEDKHNKKRAVILDIDETVLDNSVGGAYEIKNKIAWDSVNFARWVKLKKAAAIPAALDFIKFLQQRQVEVFYISNRKVAMFDDTYINLVEQGFPVKKENLLLMVDTHSKEPRRLSVEKNYHIILLVGDNLIDFHKDFDKSPLSRRDALTGQMKAEFGSRYIILPNPLYGDWENALGYDKDKIDLLKVLP